MIMTSENPGEHRRLESCLRTAVLLGLFLYVWKGVQSHLLYYGFGVFTAYPVFSWESSFLRTVFTTPGGTAEALAALLAQTYRSPPLGAVVIVAMLSILSAGIRRLLQMARAERLRDLAWAPPILALMIYTRYDDPLPTLLAIVLSVWTAVLYGSLPAKTSPVSLATFLALFVSTYYLAGASALVFACIVCLTEALLHRRALMAAIETFLACGGAFVLGGFVFGLTPGAVYTIGTPWDSSHDLAFSTLPGSLTIALYAFVPGLILVVFASRILTTFAQKRRLSPRGRPHSPKRPARDAGQRGGWRADSRLRIGLRLLGVALTATLCLVLSRNYIRYERALHYWTRQRNWDQVTALAHRMQGRRAFTRSAVFDINLALAHQGCLGEELCAYPQDEARTLFLSFDDMPGRFQHARLLELYLDLGCPNAAEKNAYELLDNEGPSPYILEALVRIHLAKGECESARIAFGALRKYAGSRPYVRRWQDIIADPAQAADHPLIRTWREAQGVVDHAVGGIAFEPMLRRLLQERPGHRLAFEYLMAYYLLKHQRGEFVNCLPMLRSLGYERLPRQYAEAVLVHSLEAKISPDAYGWTIAPDVQTEFREILGVVRGARGNNQAVFDTLAPTYGGSYTFYSMFNVCGAK